MIFKLGDKVKVAHPKNVAAPFTGIINMVLEWTNPITKKKGADYVVIADDDGQKYKVVGTYVAPSI